ncbi:flagellar biosynthesis anti-sigma factor FlgM [Zobellella iuensis]|uniref:Negative regulator of flagellin synthesis n=1 Tax=Zobellella iuensis TaxID=2803811 RepID=A0ABS1QUA0_9GAMM|nr:flagellar biosynthesis anti-sigma factor FlgM [Zobellella iuensis]MBL1378425.1 flagellar biosynthesis anti-sigma factor FlgM [Zobellella iuensis]
MAIDKIPPGLANSPALAGNGKYKGPAQGSEAKSASSPVTSQDSVSLTPEAQRLSQVQQSLASAPAPDNSARLEALKKAINEGSYQVDSERLAANISRFEQDIETLYP